MGAAGTSTRRNEVFSIVYAFLTGSCVGASKDQPRCTEECSTALEEVGIPTCPKGQVCKSKGCGKTCQPETAVEKRADSCPPVGCRCYCQYGYVKGPDGCPICECNKSPQKCPDVLCLMYCVNGFDKDDSGCPVCKCKAGSPTTSPSGQSSTLLNMLS